MPLNPPGQFPVPGMLIVHGPLRVVGQNPVIGNLDSVTQTTIAGWAGDIDQQGGVTVLLRVDTTIGTPAQTFVTSVARTDVQGAYPALPLNTGFTSPLPFSYTDGATHTVHAYAVNDDGTEVELSSSPLTFLARSLTTNHIPFGSVDQCDANTVAGWSADEDQNGAGNPTGTMLVAIVVDSNYSHATLVRTGSARGDVHSAFPQYNSITGFSSGVPGGYNDGSVHTVDVLGVDNDGPGTWYRLNGAPRTFVAHGVNTTSRELRLYDGLTGVNDRFWNDGGQVPWLRRGGDWLDANGTAWGNVPFGTVDRNTNRGDATTLVQSWLLRGNTGVYLIPNSDGAYTNRLNAFPPVLTVQTTTGTVTCSCNAANVIPRGSDSTAGLDPSGTLSAGGNPMVMQFDLSGLAGRTVTQATLQMTHVAFGPTDLQMYYLNPISVPTVWPAQPGGISENKLNVKELKADPAVLKCGDWPSCTSLFTEGNDNGYGRGIGSNPGPVFSTDTTINCGIATFQYNGDGTSQSGGTGQYEPISSEIRRTTAGQQTLQEGYLGFYIRFEDSGQGGLQQGCKTPMSFAGRLGWWNGSDYVVVCGNGQTPTDGNFYPPGQGVNSGDAGGHAYYCGWSMRTHRYPPIFELANPLYPYAAMNTYAYWRDMPRFSGGGASSGGQNFPWAGVQLRAGVWYWIDMYLKLNTVSNPDANGNGVGNNDGLFQAWVNGNPVTILDYNDFSVKTNWVWTNNATIGIDSIPWLDAFHGGGLEPFGVSKFSLGAFCVATKYIGPPNFKTTPSWLAGKTKLNWLDVPGTNPSNFDTSALAARGYNSSDGSPNWQQGIFNYSGADADRYRSAMMFLGGGGAGGWAGNDVRRLIIERDVALWEQYSLPSLKSNTWPRNGTGLTHETNPDGNLQAFHSGWSPWWSKRTQKMFALCPTHVWESDLGAWNDGWRLDDTQAPTWTKINSGVDFDSNGTSPQGRWDYPATAFDRVNDLAYVFFPYGIVRVEPVTGAAVSIFFDQNELGQMEAGAAAVGTQGVLRIGKYGGNATATTIFLPNGSNTPTFGSLVGADSQYISSADSWKYTGVLEYDDWLNCWWGWIEDGYLYKITLVSNSQFNVVRQAIGTTYSGGPEPNGSQVHNISEGVRGRMRFMPKLRGIYVHQLPSSGGFFVQTSDFAP